MATAVGLLQYIFLSHAGREEYYFGETANLLISYAVTFIAAACWIAGAWYASHAHAIFKATSPTTQEMRGLAISVAALLLLANLAMLCVVAWSLVPFA